jgi:hypothetical protein
MILYSGHKRNKHEFGTEFYISRYIMNNLIGFEHVNERICKIMVKLKYYNSWLISPHAPTEENNEVAKEEFYISSEKVWDNVPDYNMKMALGDFSAAVWKASILTYKNELRPENEERITNKNRDYYALLPLLKRQSVLRAEKKIKICRTLMRAVATFGAESCTWNKDIDKRLANFDGRVFRRMLGN